MSDEQPPHSDESEEEAPRTPFDNPFFLPMLLWIFAVWFGYDGFLNSDEHMQEAGTLWFNRIGFPIVTLLAAWFTWKAVRERRAERESEPGSSAGL